MDRLPSSEAAIRRAATPRALVRALAELPRDAQVPAAALLDRAAALTEGPFRLGLDVDGVVIDVLPPWCALYNADYDDDLAPADVTDWDMSRFTKPECGKAVYRYLAQGALYEDAPPIEGAIEGVAALREAGVDITFITSSFDGQGDAKRAWLRRYGLLPPTSADPLAADLCQWSRKARVPVDLLVDDYIGNLESSDVDGLLFAAPYNAHLTDHARFPRVPNWDALLDRVLEWAG